MRTQTRLVAAVLVAALAAAGVALRAQQPAPTTGALTALDNYLESLRQQAGIPGMSAAIVRDGAIVWEKGYGFQNVQARIRATPDTPYMVGDISGTLAAILLLECVEQRRLELDQPVSHYGLTAPEPDATLRRLLSHESPDGPKPFVYNPDRYAQLTPLMEWCAPQPYRKSVSHRILDRLAMIDSVPGTDLRDPNLSVPDDLYTPEEVDHYRRSLAKLAIPYHVLSRSRIEQSDVPLQPMTTAAGLVSTVRDLAKLDTALDSTDVLLQDETRDVAWTNAVARDGSSLPMGLGWFVQSYKGERIVWHFGQITGAYSSLMMKVPGRGLTFILLANSDNLSSPFQLSAGDVTKSLFALVFLRLAV